MADIAELERRLAGALDRLGGAHGRVRAGMQEAQARIAALEAELEERDTAAPAAAPTDGMAAEAAALRDELDEARARIDELSVALDTANDRLAAQTEAAGADRAALETAQRELDAAQRELDTSRREIVSHVARDRLETVQMGAVHETAQERVALLEAGLQALQKTAAQLRLNNAALRKALAESLPEAGLVGESLKAELASLAAARAADRAEIDSVLASLKPFLEEKADA